MENRFIIVVLLSGILTGVPASAESRTPDLFITPEQVVAALSWSSINLSPPQVSLPSAVHVRRANPDVEVSSIQPLDAQRLKVRLRCRYGADCLPFYALVTWKDADSSARVQQLWSYKTSHDSDHSSPAGFEPLVVHAGDLANLVLEGKNIRIQVPVICLAGGSTGANVRVTTTDRKHIYRASVAGPALLKGGL